VTTTLHRIARRLRSIADCIQHAGDVLHAALHTAERLAEVKHMVERDDERHPCELCDLVDCACEVHDAGSCPVHETVVLGITPPIALTSDELNPKGSSAAAVWSRGIARGAFR
jgi:hypothetical protein